MRWNHWFGIVVAVLSTAGLVFSIWPETRNSEKISFSSPEGVTGNLQLTQSEQIRVGEKNYIQLEITMNDAQNINSKLTFFSKLEMGNLVVTPKGEGKVSIDPSKNVGLNWQLAPYEAGKYSGTLWLFLESANGTRNLILAKPIELEAKTLLGFSFRTARSISIIGLIISTFLLLLNRTLYKRSIKI
jgi:hypothetical protein